MQGFRFLENPWCSSDCLGLFGSQIGSYFGSVLTTVDVDKDSNTDVLLVGAPMFMGAEKEEQGKVYVYSVNQVMGPRVRGQLGSLCPAFNFRPRA